MSKRIGNLNDLNSNNAKKPRIDETLDDLWGDDLDVEDIDDCLMLATQLCQQTDVVCTQRNNVSILPSYSGFKQTTKQLFTSTQKEHNILNNGINKSLNDSGSKAGSSFKRAQSFDCGSKDNLELKVKQLQEQCEVKSGEVSILRTKLQDIRAHHESEQNKVQKEWSEKLLVKTKQLRGAESELEFKNLEILNLTQKLKEATKLNNVNVTRSPFLKQPDLNKSTADDKPDSKKENDVDDFKIQLANDQSTYPLKDVIQKHVFTVSFQEMCSRDVNKKSMYVKHAAEHELTRSVLKLAQLNKYELDLIENQKYVSNLLSLSEQLLQNLYRFLENLKAGTCTEETRTINLEVMCLESFSVSKDEMGFNAKETVICISQVLPFSNYLKELLILNSSGTYLDLLLSTVQLINELKLSINFCCFLQSTTALLHKISEIYNFSELTQYSVISNLTKELILCTTNKSAFKRFLIFLNNAALQRNFLSSLCGVNVGRSELQLTRNKKILSYTRSTCVVQILFIVLEEYLKENSLDSNATALSFMSNSIISNPTWLLYQEDKCPCVFKVAELYIGVMYKTLQLTNSSGGSQFANEVLKSGIDTLYTLNFQYLVDKYLATYSRYKVVVKSLLNMKDVLELRDSKVELLEDLNKNDKVIAVPEDAFRNINLWKSSILD